MACFLLVWLLHQKGIGILHPLMLSGLGITATPSREKDVITNSAALQVVRAHLIAYLDFSALITGLLVWHLADDSLQPEQQGCYPEWPSWFQPRQHLWDRVACMSDARGLLQFCRLCSLRSDKAGMSLGSGILRIEAASERGSMSTVIARGLSRLRIRGSHFSCFFTQLWETSAQHCFSQFLCGLVLSIGLAPFGFSFLL